MSTPYHAPSYLESDDQPMGIGNAFFLLLFSALLVVAYVAFPLGFIYLSVHL